MSEILQLSVAVRQQPMRGLGRGTLQPVVANDKGAARQRFSRLFNAELDRVGIPTDRARISAVYKGLHHNRKKLVSREQVRKWIRGIDIPDAANLRLVCERLKLDWTRLQPGSEPETPDPLFIDLKTAWEALRTDTARMELIRYARYLGATDGASIQARPEGTDSDSEAERASLQRHRRA
jgi:hypothetical protein